MKHLSKEIKKELIRILPERKAGKRGTKPIAKETLLEGLLLRLRYNVCWEDVPHSATVRRYMAELQRRGFFSNKINEMIGLKKKEIRS